MLGVVLFVVVWIALTAGWIAALVDASRYAPSAFRAARRSRGGTLALVALFGWIGGAYYWLVIRREVKKYREAPADPEQWFTKLGYDVEYDDADNSTWASLRRRSNPSELVRQYGQGRTPNEAVANAKHRWEVEQHG